MAKVKVEILGWWAGSLRRKENKGTYVKRLDVTGTWSKKWAQGKFGNQAIEVRSFSGVGTGLGSGAVPPGMSL